MSSSKGFTLIETLVALLIGVAIVVGIGGLSERLVHHRVTTDSNSAAMSLAERQMETLLAIPPLSANPPAGCTTAQDLCGGPPPSGLTHGPTSVNENLAASASGPYSVRWVVIDANSTDPTNSPLVLAVGPTSLVKKITVTVSHLRNPQVSATLARYYGFTLIELLVVMVVAGVLLAGFTAFYLSQQRTVRHHQIEVETSQALRTALEQISRDLRSARKDITRDFYATPPSGGAQPTFITADTTNVRFQLDANDDGVISADGTGPNLLGLLEHKGYRLTGSTLEQYDASVTTNNWVTLADYVSAFTLTYRDCNQAILTAPVASPNSIKSSDISITVNRPVIGGLPVVRTESESIQLRNVRCP